MADDEALVERVARMLFAEYEGLVAVVGVFDVGRWISTARLALRLAREAACASMGMEFMDTDDLNRIVSRAVDAVEKEAS